MKFLSSFLACVAVSSAFPSMLGGHSKHEMLHMLQKRHAEEQLEKRQGLIPSVSSLLNDVSGLLGSVASSVDPDNYRPEPGYHFQAPGPNDSRGPCPGLNLLANYGYLPRDGYVNFGQVVDATA